MKGEPIAGGRGGDATAIGEGSGAVFAAPADTVRAGVDVDPHRPWFARWDASGPIRRVLTLLRAGDSATDDKLQQADVGLDIAGHGTFLVKGVSCSLRGRQTRQGGGPGVARRVRRERAS